MHKALITLLWIASALLTYWLGLEQGSDFAYYGPGKLSLPNENNLTAKKNEGISHVTSKASPVLPPISSTYPVEVVEAEPNWQEERIYESQTPDLRERIKSSNPVVRLRAFSELVEDGSPQSIERAKEIYEKLPEGPQRFSELRLLAFSWGQSDPESALQWSNNLDGFDKKIGIGSVLDSWARNDSESAIAWAKENFEGEDNPYYPAIVSGMSENDLVGASQLMTTLPYGRTRGRAASILVEKTWQMGEEAAIDFADNLPEGSIKNFAFGEIAKKIAKDDLGRAVEWVNKMDESDVKVRVSEDVAERWAKNSPAEAAEWVSHMQEGEARSKSMEKVVTQWARKDPTATAEWLNQFSSGELMDEPIQCFIREVARKDPDTALTWAQSITDEQRRKKVEADVLNIKVIEAQQEQAEAAKNQTNESGLK